MESIEERINEFIKNLNKEKVEARTEEQTYNSKFLLLNDHVEINGVIIGMIVPKDENYDLSYYYNNVYLIIADFELQKDYNSNKLIFRLNGDKLRLVRVDSIDLEEYVENYLDDVDYETRYKMCESYWCSPQDLVDNVIDNEPIEEIIGNAGKFEVDNTEYLSIFDSGWDLKNIIENVEDDEDIVFFDNTNTIIQDLSKYKYSAFEENRDLTMEDMGTIANLINKLCETDNIIKNIIKEVE